MILDVLKECLNLLGIFLIISASLLISETLFIGLVMLFINAPVIYYFFNDDPDTNRMIALILTSWFVIIFVDFLMEAWRPLKQRIFWIFAYPMYLGATFVVTIAISNAFPDGEHTDFAMAGAAVVLFLAVVGLREVFEGFGWRRKTLSKIANSNDISELRSEYLENDYTAEYLRKATRKRISELED